MTDRAWQRIEPLLPKADGRGRPWRDHRQVINGILWRLRTGAPWREVPERYGPWKTCYDRFARWEQDGTWALLQAELQLKTSTVSEDGTADDSVIVLPAQRVAEPRKRGGRKRTTPEADTPAADIPLSTA